MSKSSPRTHVAVSATLKLKLDNLAADFLKVYQSGRRTRFKPVEQGGRGSWIPLADIIEAAVDDFIAHRQRGRSCGGAVITPNEQDLADAIARVNPEDEVYAAVVSETETMSLPLCDYDRIAQSRPLTRAALNPVILPVSDYVRQLDNNVHIGEGTSSPIKLVEGDL